MNSNTDLAGSFWSEIINDELFHRLINAREIIEEQTQQDMSELQLMAGRETTPIYHRILLQPLQLKLTEKRDLSWPLPESIVAISTISDKINSAKHTWRNNRDFKIGKGYITFHKNPFTRGPEQDHHELNLWMKDVDYDEGYLNDMWGTVVGINAPSSEEYRTLLCLLYEAIIGGTSRKHVEQIVALLNGAAFAKEDEVVVEVRNDRITTDKNVYLPVNDGQPIVVVGSKLNAGDLLFDTCRFYRDYVQPDVLPSLTLPSNYLDSYIKGDLTFHNREVPLVFTNNCVEFEVGGSVDVVKRFWDLFNSRRTDDGRSLTDLLAGQITINPLKFVQQNVIAHNCLLCVLTEPKTPLQLMSIDQKRILHSFVPPHETLLVVNQKRSKVIDK